MEYFLVTLAAVTSFAAPTARAGDGFCPEHYPDRMVFTLRATVTGTTGGGVITRSDGGERMFVDQEIENFLYRPGETIAFTWDANLDELTDGKFCFPEDEIVAKTLSGAAQALEVAPTATGRAHQTRISHKWLTVTHGPWPIS